jgi:hypothetical protein
LKFREDYILNIRKIPPQVFALVLLFAITIAVLLVSRTLLIPPSFGEHGHYRGDVIGEVASQKINYAGMKECIECHDDIDELKENSNHRDISCEVCHGPAAEHVDEPDAFLPSIPSDRGFCPLCHGYNSSRPLGFPQIIPTMHNPGKACMSCHNPHDPQVPHPPQECSACHRNIVNEQLVSHHASLECESCHTVSEGHLIQPRLEPAQIPKEREFCGNCHSNDADSSRGIPKIDMGTHWKRYACWDCHYPHHPEVSR